MTVLVRELNKNLELIEVNYIGWETDFYQNATYLEGMSMFSDSLNKSMFIKDITKEKYEEILKSVNDTTKVIDLSDYIEEDYPDEFNFG